MANSPPSSLLDPFGELNSTPQVLVGDTDDLTLSSIDISKTLASGSSREVELNNVSPPPSEPVRKRYELRQKFVNKGEDFELSVLPSLPEGSHASAVEHGSGDIEFAPRSSNASASSVRVEGGVDFTSPVLSPVQSTAQRWKGRMHFAALCYFLFLEGWNDGTTGPLLPTIQKYHNVCEIALTLILTFNTCPYQCRWDLPSYLSYSFSIVS